MKRSSNIRKKPVSLASSLPATFCWFFRKRDMAVLPFGCHLTGQGWYDLKLIGGHMPTWEKLLLRKAFLQKKQEIEKYYPQVFIKYPGEPHAYYLNQSNNSIQSRKNPRSIKVYFVFRGLNPLVCEELKKGPDVFTLSNWYEIIQQFKTISGYKLESLDSDMKRLTSLAFQFLLELRLQQNAALELSKSQKTKQYSRTAIICQYLDANSIENSPSLRYAENLNNSPQLYQSFEQERGITPLVYINNSDYPKQTIA